MTSVKMWLRFATLIALSVTAAISTTSSAHLPVEARDDTSSQEEDIISTSYVLPNQIFNDGKPYYAGKDPVSGQLDFNAKKPAGIEPAANEVIDPKEKIVLSNASPNIHDFLNLPVKYSSSKFVYPLVSSSYANLKYQGSNKNYMTNKKPTSVVAPVTAAPSYHSPNYYTIATTKLMAVPSSAPGRQTSSSSSSTSTTTTSTKPVTSSTTTTTKPYTKAPISSTTTQKYTATASTTTSSTTTRKPTTISTTTAAPRSTTSSTTRKKFVPTKKYSPSTTIAATSTPLRFPDERPVNGTTVSHAKPTTTTVFTTRQPPTQTSIFSTVSTSSNTKAAVVTRKPVTFTENPNVLTSSSSTLSGSTRLPNLDPADVYQTLGQKNTAQKIEQKPSMTLADIFNSLAEEESAVNSNNKGDQGLDSQGNLMQPFSPSKPSPFSVQGQPQRPFPTRASFGSTVVPHTQQQLLHQQQQQKQQQQTTQHQQQQQTPHDQKVISGSQENYSNEYVSYQVQQPNVMQYRPAPGAINNVHISAGQDSASFVLGSQQQVGANAYGSVEKETLIGKKPAVQYGQVINEDISALQRQPAPTSSQQSVNLPASQPTQYQQLAGQGVSNFHQNGNFGPAPAETGSQYAQRPWAGTGATDTYQEPPPAPPSPYQQLPLVDSNTRPQQTNKQQLPHSMSNTENAQPLQPQNNYEESPAQAALPQTAFPQTPNTQAQPQPQQDHKRPPSPQDTKELLVSTNIRFPANEDQSDEVSSRPVSSGPPAGPQINGHAQPLSLQQLQSANPVVFPNVKDEQSSSATSADEIQIQQHDVLTMNQHQQKVNFPQHSEHLTPSQHMEPPPLPNLVSEHGPPQAIRPHGQPSFAHNEYKRKPIPGITRPNPDGHLPNILPQFRPNAKISSNHPSSNYNQEPGNIHITGPPPKRLNPSPQFAHRRQPMLQQKRYPMNRISEYPAGPPPPPSHIDANRRVYRLPPYGGQGLQYIDRMYGRRPMPYGPRPADSYAGERHAPITNPDFYKPERMAAFEEEDLVINDPPQPVTPSKDHKSIAEIKLEPVVTLQMLQSQKKTVSLPSDDTGSGEIQVPSEPENTEYVENTSSQNGLYVVYPMKTDKDDENVVADIKDALPAVAHIDPPTGSEYQNTPFSVVRDQPQEPILMVKNKQPQSLQQQTKTQPLKEKFPYVIEKPDPSYSELNAQKRVPGVLIAPRIVNGAYATGTVAPIAIAYTPTEPNPYRHAGHYSNVNLATSVINEIRPDTQTEDGLNNDFDVRGQNFEKDFMAPFYPSMSLGTATNTPTNGWNILPSSTDHSVYEKNKINRADVGETSGDTDLSDTTTKSFGQDSFQPELQGGFKPIYPPGYTIEDGNEHAQQHLESSNDKPYALASHMQPTHRIDAVSGGPATPSTTSSSSSSTTTTTSAPHTSTSQPYTSTAANADKAASSTTVGPAPSTTASSITPKPTQRKKSTFETSLEALLFGDDADFEEEEEARKKSTPKKAPSGPRSVPRMGPRNIKLS